MRTMLLSFKPSVYQKIYDGVKIFEHRRNFPNEPIIAYMYVSKPIRAIKGIVYLKNRHTLTDWEDKFADCSATIERIKKYEESYRYAMEIVEFQETSEIGLDDLKREFPSFVVPQSYIYLERNPKLLRYIETHLNFLGKNIKNDFSCVTSEQICIQ